jgi:hypothetical protein
MFNLVGVVIEIAETVQRLALRVNANDLMTETLTGGGDDLDSGIQIIFSGDKFEQSGALKYR